MQPVNEIALLIKRVISFPGDYSEGETPDPIPNSEVKPFSADDTATGGKVGRCQVFSFFFLGNNSYLEQ